MLKIRYALPEDVENVSRLFRKTIRTINSKDYDPLQINIWSSKYNDTTWWLERIRKDCFLIAEMDQAIVGFASLTSVGLLELMYVHKDFQGNGIGSALMKALEENYSRFHFREIISEVSITAKPYFEKMGFCVLRRNTRILDGIQFINFVMRKKIGTL
jgi:putative acetyltransferase